MMRKRITTWDECWRKCPAALRMRSPKARLLFWHALLAACLLIPLVQPWRSEAITATVQVSTGATILAR